MTRVCAKVNFMRYIVSICVVDGVRRDVDSVYPLAVAMKISRWHYFY